MALKGRTSRNLIYAALFVLSIGALTLLSTPKRRLAVVEKARLVVDYVTCSPQAQDQMRSGFDRQAILDREVEDNCYRVTPANYDGPVTPSQLPSVYIAEQEMLALFPSCAPSPEAYFMDAMKKNFTGNIVKDGHNAEFVFVPFPATGTCDPPLGKRALPAAFDAVVHLPGRKFTVNRRPFPERTNAQRGTRQMLKEFPEVIFLNPEIKNLQPLELPNPDYRNHIVTPQWPRERLDFEIFKETFASDWERPYNFCYSATNLNPSRQYTADLLMARDDSYLHSNCRATRAKVMADLQQKSTDLYSRCRFCPVPRGDAQCDIRYYDTMRAGCIPIVYEKARPLPFVHRLDYDSWSLVNFDTSKKGLRNMFNKLASMPDAEFHRRQQLMLKTIEQLTLRDCAGQPLMYHLMLALTEAGNMADLYGASYLEVPQVTDLHWKSS
eukprot:TRINITY_DN12636_c1_g1_i2.p1 TRINITY_DN12636_c1_g1~~TRINITY_DN12636_c1_g1_i2.p1  ORF type:complete len:439 (+),score=71.28 TRINITY_DN12636_c1_g1_i2:1115-2431(+)